MNTPGDYYYTPHGNMWGIYKRCKENRNAACLQYTKPTRQEAKEDVYRLNGWQLTTNN